MSRLSAHLLVAALKAWLYLRPFRTVVWVVVTMAVGYSARLLFGLGTTSMEVILVGTNAISVLLAARAAYDSYGDYLYQLASDGNGKIEVADEEVGQDAIRVAASGTLFLAAILLLQQYPHPDYPALVSRHGMLFASWFLLAAIVRERFSRRVLRLARRAQRAQKFPHP